MDEGLTESSLRFACGLPLKKATEGKETDSLQQELADLRKDSFALIDAAAAARIASPKQIAHVGWFQLLAIIACACEKLAFESHY